MTILTEWAGQLDPDDPRPEYPRPQLVRPRWTNLNGRWAASVHAPGRAPTFDQTIVVPFPIGSTLSGIEHVLQPDETLSVRRSFTAPSLAVGERLRLHFGAVDWECEVWVNGDLVGTHQGGFDPFHFDITDALVEADDTGAGRRDVRSDRHRRSAARASRRCNPFAIQYTAVAGIWQTVWLEPVPVGVRRVASSTRATLADAGGGDRSRVGGRRARRRYGSSPWTTAARSARVPPVVAAGGDRGARRLAELRPWSPARSVPLRPRGRTRPERRPDRSRSSLLRRPRGGHRRGTATATCG